MTDTNQTATVVTNTAPASPAPVSPEAVRDTGKARFGGGMMGF